MSESESEDKGKKTMWKSIKELVIQTQALVEESRKDRNERKEKEKDESERNEEFLNKCVNAIKSTAQETDSEMAKTVRELTNTVKQILNAQAAVGNKAFN